MANHSCGMYFCHGKATCCDTKSCLRRLESRQSFFPYHRCTLIGVSFDLRPSETVSFLLASSPPG